MCIYAAVIITAGRKTLSKLLLKRAPGGAWLSSVRVLKRLVNSSNERNP